jgi:hypothetical protein
MNANTRAPARDGCLRTPRSLMPYAMPPLPDGCPFHLTGRNMHSKWADACGQIIAFDRALSTECNLTNDPFCCHIVRLFSQMSAMATMRLHVVEPGESLRFDAIEGKHPARVHMPTLSKHGKKSKSNASIAPAEPEGLVRQTTAKISLQQNQMLSSVMKAADHHDDGKLKRQRTKAEKINELGDGINRNERDLLLAAPCPVFATAQRIQRAIITRLHAGGMRAPPPIISRIFQEVSNGLLFYNNATKMKEVPVPFPYVQLNAFLLNAFSCILCPVAIASFTPVMWLSVSTTVVTVISFYAVFLVANELEDPFGTEDNDMPMIEYHEEFCASLCAILTSAWLPEDQWLVKEGKWVHPRTIALASNAFTDKIGKRGVAYSNKGFEKKPRPMDTLLNRAKANRRTGLLSVIPGGIGAAKRSKTVALPGVVVPHDLEDFQQHACTIQRKVRAHYASKAIAREIVTKQPTSGADAPAQSAAPVDVSLPDPANGSPRLPPIAAKTNE